MSGDSIKYNKKQLEEILNGLNNISVVLTSSEAESAMFAALNPMVKEAKKRVTMREPAPNRRHLRDVIERSRRQPEGREVFRVGIWANNRKYKKYFKPGSRWHWEEFGTKHRKRRLSPFFRPAFENHKNSFMPIFERNMARSLKNAAKGKVKLKGRYKVYNTTARFDD